jgi:hypothetical protein
MADESTRPRNLASVSAGTSDRVAGMSDEERAELARKMAAEQRAVPDASTQSPVVLPYRPSRRAQEALDEETEVAIVRVGADLHRTERRLQQLDRKSSRSRYQMTTGSGPTGRYARLLRRADRLERQLRALRASR